MQDSARLMAEACRGERPERTPIFDILVNDAIIAHFAGAPLDGTDDLSVSARAIGRALDGTRHLSVPNEEGKTWTDGWGNEYVAYRWTVWQRKHARPDVERWKQWITSSCEQMEAKERPTPEQCQAAIPSQLELLGKLYGTQYIFCTPSTAINHALFGGCGLEVFSYLWADDRALVLRWLRALEQANSDHIALTAHKETAGLAMIYSDIAYKQRLMFSREMFGEMGFFEDVERICAQCHERGLQVIFHSDGYIMDIIADLIAAGVDGINPLEKAAGMDVYELRRQHPETILVGGMDVTHLMPNGTPEEVRAETRRMIRETGSEGRLLIGSSTEMEPNVPLANYLAFWDEVMKG